MAARTKKTRRGKRFPCPIAAIDVGSTSIRMEVAEIGTGDTPNTLEELVHPASLGADTFRYGIITPQSMRGVCRVLQGFAQVLKEYGVTTYRAAATSAIREASNRDVVVDRIGHESGIALEVLDAVEETRLTYQTLQPFLKENLLDPDLVTLVLDLGGGSTETMILHGHDLVLVGSRKLGTARLFHSLESSDVGDTQALIESVIRNVVDSTVEVYQEHLISNCVVINSLLSTALANEPGALPLAGGLLVPSQAVRKAARDAGLLAIERLPERFDISVADAELLGPALMVLERLIDSLHIPSVMIAQVELVPGILNDLVLGLRGKNPVLAFHDQIVHSAKGYAEKYHYDADHSLQVARLALMLYDDMADNLDLEGNDRLLLEVAAILHDIGMYVNESAHHKHSAYLVQWAEIVGLSHADRTLVSLITRYHRKASPRPQHLEFASLGRADRLRVTKLSAILRIADALDRSHRQIIDKVSADLRETELVLRARSRTDLIVESNALKEKGKLFTETTGLDIRLKRTAD